jgi:hypothetical protein
VDRFKYGGLDLHEQIKVVIVFSFFKNDTKRFKNKLNDSNNILLV